MAEINRKFPHKNGFTLVELSIVLVIIGLLIGGILVAQSMISTTKVQRLIIDLQKYSVAVSNFRLNYKQWPGDSNLFVPPGNNDQSTQSNGTCAAAPYATLFDDERLEGFPQLSESGMLDTNYVPFSFVTCGGTQTDVNVGALNFPTTKVDRPTGLGSNDVAINIEGINNDYHLSFFVNPLTALPLEAKLGSRDNALGLSPGLANAEAAGKCEDADDELQVDCTDPRANWGAFVYILAQ